MPEDNPKPKKTGCAILFVPTLIVIDCVGMLLGMAAPYSRLVPILSIVGLGVGVVLGAYLWAKNKESTSCSISFWLVSGGLIGISIPAFVGFAIVQHWLANHPH
jgi:hypothetical protein